MKRVTRRQRAAMRRGCEGKVAHPTEDSAMQALRKLRRTTTSMLSAYQCAACQAWHVGHTPFNVRASIIAKRRNAQ